MKTPVFTVLVAVASLALAACDASTPASAEAVPSTLSTTPSVERAEQVFVVPSDIPELVFARAEADAAKNACGARATVLPAGTRVRVVEENGTRRVFFGPSEATPIQVHLAAVGGDTGKGDGMVNTSGQAAQRGPEVEFTCKCLGGPQTQTTGCTPAYNPGSGHVYCDAYGDCNQCQATVSS